MKNRRNQAAQVTNVLNKYLNKVQPWQTFLAIVIAVICGIYGADSWVKTSARNAILDEQFLAKLAMKVRPLCIFNTKGAIEADAGAMEYIEDIRVTPVPKKYGYEIVIKPKRHLAYAPLVSGIDVDLFTESATRGKLHEWIIILDPQSTVSAITTETEMNTNAVHRFKLEMLH